jgi:hypothetical protein
LPQPFPTHPDASGDRFPAKPEADGIDLSINPITIDISGHRHLDAATRSGRFGISIVQVGDRRRQSAVLRRPTSRIGERR